MVHVLNALSSRWSRRSGAHCSSSWCSRVVSQPPSRLTCHRWRGRCAPALPPAHCARHRRADCAAPSSPGTPRALASSAAAAGDWRFRAGTGALSRHRPHPQRGAVLGASGRARQSVGVLKRPHVRCPHALPRTTPHVFACLSARVVHMYMHKYMLVLTHVHTRNFKDSEREATQHAKGNVHTPHACRNYYDVEKSIRRLLLPEQLIQVFQSACAWGGTAQHATPSASVFAA